MRAFLIVAIFAASAFAGAVEVTQSELHATAQHLNYRRFKCADLLQDDGGTVHLITLQLVLGKVLGRDQIVPGLESVRNDFVRFWFLEDELDVLKKWNQQAVGERDQKSIAYRPHLFQSFKNRHFHGQDMALVLKTINDQNALTETEQRLQEEMDQPYEMGPKLFLHPTDFHKG